VTNLENNPNVASAVVS